MKIRFGAFAILLAFSTQTTVFASGVDADQVCKDAIKEKIIKAWSAVIDSAAGPITNVAKVEQIPSGGSAVKYKASEFWNDNWIIGAAAIATVEMTEDGCRVIGFSIHE